MISFPNFRTLSIQTSSIRTCTVLSVLDVISVVLLIMVVMERQSDMDIGHDGEYKPHCPQGTVCYKCSPGTGPDSYNCILKGGEPCLFCVGSTTTTETPNNTTSETPDGTTNTAPRGQVDGRTIKRNDDLSNSDCSQHDVTWPVSSCPGNEKHYGCNCGIVCIPERPPTEQSCKGKRLVAQENPSFAWKGDFVAFAQYFGTSRMGYDIDPVKDGLW